MIGRFKLNTLAVLLLAAAFCWFFMFAKHDPSLAPIVPFADDPWDAVGSYCFIASFLLAGLVLFRTVRLGGQSAATRPRSLYLARAQMALPSAILITVLTDLLAMSRHLSQWLEKPESRLLLLLLGGLAVFALLVAAMIGCSARCLTGTSKFGPLRKTSVTFVLSMLILSMFPESLIESIPLHFLAIILGFVLIAAPQAGIIITLLPDNSPTVAADARAKAHARSRFGWALAAFSGAAMGALLAAAEFIENRSGHAPMSRVALVAALFVGSGMALLLVAYAFLREPLGLFPRERPC